MSVVPPALRPPRIDGTKKITVGGLSWGCPPDAVVVVGRPTKRGGRSRATYVVTRGGTVHALYAHAGRVWEIDLTDATKRHIAGLAVSRFVGGT